MAKRIKECKCANCHESFPPDARNAWHQRYCKKSECRKASKAASQRRWLEKEENRGHFRGPENVERVREWRKSHPGYWRRKRSEEEGPLQDLLTEKPEENPSVETQLPVERSLEAGPLQDLLTAQVMILTGLIAQLTGSALQDDIAFHARRLQQLGADILNGPTLKKGDSHDSQKPHPCRAHTPDARTV